MCGIDNKSYKLRGSLDREHFQFLHNLTCSFEIQTNKMNLCVHAIGTMVPFVRLLCPPFRVIELEFHDI